jgi:acyl transferase domain-containing protein/NAD(P)H-dependent flavin oxidoreductase YrpB (nitropropane dioxygenase family)
MSVADRRGKIIAVANETAVAAGPEGTAAINSAMTDLVIAVNPLSEPSARFAAAAVRAGCLGVLDLTAADRSARAELARAAEWITTSFGVRLAGGSPFTDADLPARARTILLADWSGAGSSPSPADFTGRRVLVEVTDPEVARAAALAGADGLIARGHEAGGRIGELSTFVLLQRLLADDLLDLPVWACGGIGPHTAAAAVAGGAAGVVLDTQLALLAEADLPVEIAAVISTLDGSETTIADGQRVLQRRPAATDPAGPPVPIGQDIFLASRFQAAWGTVGAAVRGVRDAVLNAVGPEEPAALGGLPVAQGPMTRVSDQAGFAAAVAKEGALPFIALALSGPAQTRTMLEETRDALAGAPWGVGVLGFAAEEIKAAQLEVIREIRPSHAIIAGGRPAQAAALEEVGISTFLHVPSPGLLKQFLAAGARKFIFEGAECGGHVGPRNSFPLWEAQLGVISDFLAGKNAVDAAELQVLFAGGVHDERSAAMIAAMATPLTARGAAVGVLMGTAYLFTSEAVEAGAVLPLFQQQVIAAERTDLLETAPGHATRCVASPFTAEYAAIKQDLQSREVPSRDAWEQLEQLNVGRLRLASKGIERVGDELRPVDEPRQLAAGMFMAGEVAVLRSAVTTIAELHASVGPGATAFLTERTNQLRQELGLDTEPQPTGPEPLDIAVVGMSCMFPQAPDLSTFWANVLSGADSVTEVPAQRWDQSVYYAPDGDGDRTPSRWGGFLPEIPFDPLRYGIPPASLASIEPVQLLALEAAHRALVDAGYGSRDFDRSKTSVVFGAEAGSDLSNATTLRTVLPAYFGEIPAGLDNQLPRLTEDSFPGMLANVIAGRVANRLDLGGANYTVDAACASSLTAVDVACKELTSGTSDLVLCGGADLHNGINDYLLFASVHALSPTGRSATFDDSADGIALGEGVACVALKRLADAERDGDRVYAVIKGVGSASDGRSLGLTAPRPEGQRNALERAYRNAGISPADVGLLEAHGTGTVVGDRTELTTLTKVFTAAGAAPGSCAIGSVKSQIGHTKCAAGLAGLVKTALALHTGIKPPTLHVRQPNAAWDAETSPFVFHSSASPWAETAAERIAGVSAFGFGGTNFHVVLSAYDGAPPPEHAVDEWPVELFTFRTVKHAEELLALVEAGPDKFQPWRLRDFALSAARRHDLDATRGTATRIALLASDPAELATSLRRAIAGEHDPDAGIFLSDSDDSPGAVAMLFPGQGSQRPGMFADLFVAFPELQSYLRMGNATTTEALYPPASFDERGREAQLARITDTRVAQPALGIVGLAAHHLLSLSGVQPSMMAGHSFGELIALTAAGSLTADALIECSSARAEAILAATGAGDPGTMAAVAAGAPQVTEALKAAGLDGSVVTANRNSPRQTVISGPTEEVELAVEQLRAGGLGAKRIPVACAFHSPLVAAAGDTFAKMLDSVVVSAPEVPVWSNRTARVYPSEPERIRAELGAQIGAPVGFVEQIEAMYAAGARVFIEAGPGSVLTRLVDTILGDRIHRTVALEGKRRSGLSGLLAALAQLAVAGVDIRTGWMFHGREAVDASRASRPQRAGWTVDGQLVRTADGVIPVGALHPAHRVQAPNIPAPSALEPTMSNGHYMNGTDGQQTSGPDSLIADFLRTSREMIAAQRDVMLGYLGAAPSERQVSPVTYPSAPLVIGQVATADAVPEPSVPVPVAGPVPSVPALSEASVLAAVLEVIAERTGYPVEMIEPDLDLEADLSVDSIKRAEIAGELASRLGLPADGEIEELSQARTAARITALVVGQAAAAETVPALTVAPAPVASVPALSEASVLTAVLEVIAERTGYPVDMIEPDLDLEADLSVDSIKRAEIAGELASRLGLPADGEIEELSQARTAARITALIVGRLTAAGDPGPAPALTEPLPGPLTAAEPAARSEGVGGSPIVVAPKRLVHQEFELRKAEIAVGELIGRKFLLIGGGSLAPVLAAKLGALGAEATTVPATEVPLVGNIDGAFHLGAALPVLPDAFPTYQAVLAASPRWLIAAGPVDGLRGFFRTVSREYPDTIARVVEHEAGAALQTVADGLIAELAGLDREPVVLRVGGGRRGLRLEETSLGLLGSTGAGPAGDGAAEAAAIGLDRDSVILLAGGAKGITARFAATLAAAARCRIELLGRTVLPVEDEVPAIAAATGEGELRSALITGGMRVPAEIERAIRKIESAREIRATISRLSELGSQVRYHSVDLRDNEAVHGAVKEIHAEHGRIDGVVYAAGVIEDKLIAEKTFESFANVYRTKVDGAQALLDATDDLPAGPRFAVLFGSIAAALGNRGQVDYASANDALEQLGRRWSGSDDRRGLTIHWGPWAPTGSNNGMVTPELMRSYANRGIELIDPEEGTLSLLRELAWGPRSANAVVYSASGW